MVESREQTFESAFRTIFRELLTGISTSMPGIVTSFDGKNRVSVQPAIQILVEGELQTVSVIEDVPVLFPGGGGFKITWPVSEGDECLLIFAQRDISNWKTQGNVVVPYSSRRFDKSDAIAIVGLESFANPPDVGTAVRISGSGGAGGDFAALSSKVDDFIAKMDNMFRTWTPVVNDGGGALKTKFTAAFPTAPDTVASETLELDK